MKLFVWYGYDVLASWTSGQIVCIAKDLETALQVIDETDGATIESFPRENPTEIIDLGELEAEPKAWITWGGD
ncbi:hypothetical protein NGG16_02655 [Enterococcus casseliflavus]|uniref:hypothetical protein n=1 Tax=Enterococcus casseliflavus TaxID=37734 RepID=UPI002DBAE1A3|nr:hypothetical protein [Enterococcus casseliflavus]MEB8416334.1 hypothetical protein [Enterococcus casseliflavus]